MDQLDSMSKARSILGNSTVEHNSRPPLRWIANWAGGIASRHMLELSYMEDEGLDKGFRYKYYGWLWDTFWPLYQKYGTFYKLDLGMDGPGWDDYDADGIPYWGNWDYEDPETGDAFRVINFGGKE